MEKLELLKKKFFDNYLLITLKDGRNIYGDLKALDDKGNLVVHNSIVEIPKNKISPLNEFITYQFDPFDKKVLRLEKVIEKEILETQKKTFFENKFGLGGVILSIEHIKNIQIVKKKKKN